MQLGISFGLVLTNHYANWAVAAVLWSPVTDVLLADCRKEEDVDPEQIRKDIERLQLIKQKRLDCSLQSDWSRHMCLYCGRATAGNVVSCKIAYRVVSIACGIMIAKLIFLGIHAA